MKEEITKEQTILDLRVLFDIREDTRIKGFDTAAEEKGVFYVNKNYIPRSAVISILKRYFKKRMFVPGYGLSIEPMTLVHTRFEIITLKN